MTINNFCISIVIGVATLNSGALLLASSIVVDDFEIDQTLISTDPNAEYETLLHPDILGGERNLWGGGELVMQVSGGLLTISSEGDSLAAGSVTWSGSDISGETIFANDLNLNLSEHWGIEFDIAELSGPVLMGFTISSGGYWGHLVDGQTERIRRTYYTPGRHIMYFSDFEGSPGPVNYSDIDNITFGARVEQGGFVSIDSVRLVVPEPTGFIGTLLPLLCVVSLLRNRPRVAPTAGRR